MGVYLNPPGIGPCEKSVWLREQGTPLEGPPEWEDTPDGQCIICCVDNYGHFEAAAVCHNPEELAEFNRIDDPRPKAWFYLDKKIVATAARGLF